MTVYRMARAEEESRLLDLINFVFSQSARPHDFKALLPKVYANPGFHQIHAVAEKEGRLVAAVAVMPLLLKLGQRELRGGYVGSVSVHKEHRGEGHMKALMELQISRAKEAGLDFLALGGQRQRYNHWDFEACGQSVEFSISPASARHALRDTREGYCFVSPEGKEDYALISALHQQIPFRAERPEALLPQILRSYGGCPLMLQKKDTGEKTGYLMLMEDTVTELRLKDESELPAVMKSLIQEKGRLRVQAPSYLPRRAMALQQMADGCDICETEMLLPLNWEKVLSSAFQLKEETALTGYSEPHPLPDGERTLEIEGEGAFVLRVQNGKAEVEKRPGPGEAFLTRRQAVETLFSPVCAFYQPDPLLRCWLPLPWGIAPTDTF